MKENMIDYIIKNKLLFFLIILLYLIVGLLSIFFYFNLSNIKRNNYIESSTIEKNIINESKNNSENYIYVDIKGNVKNPGVYKTKENSRVIDVVKLSGGLLKDSNTRFNNMSKIVKDGEVIVIYTNKEIEDAKKSNTIYVETPCVCEEVTNNSCYNDNTLKEEKSVNKLININTATLDELDALNGIGKSKAQSIIDYRTKNGKFNKLEDLLKVNGISETIFNKIKENITV